MTAIDYPKRDELHTRGFKQHGVPAERFARSYIVEATGCWHWMKARTTTGYGHFSIARVYYQAHRIAYILHRGTVPTDMFLDHLCRNRWCVNPAHLEIVTHQENVRRGVRTRLTPAKAESIRAALATGLSQRHVGSMFGVDHSTVSRIANGQLWTQRQDVAA